MSTGDFPSRWALEVCRTCGRRALWPFCEHRRNGDWFVTITVTGKVPAQDRRKEVKP